MISLGSSVKLTFLKTGHVQYHEIEDITIDLDDPKQTVQISFKDAGVYWFGCGSYTNDYQSFCGEVRMSMGDVL